MSHTQVWTCAFEPRICLSSFPVCYSNELEELSVCQNGGVPLEHLISCVPGVTVAVSKSGVKKVLWLENKPSIPIGQSSYATLIHGLSS